MTWRKCKNFSMCFRYYRLEVYFTIIIYTLAKRWAQSSAVIANKVFYKGLYTTDIICYATLLLESLSEEMNEDLDKCHSCIIFEVKQFVLILMVQRYGDFLIPEVQFVKR